MRTAGLVFALLVLAACASEPEKTEAPRGALGKPVNLSTLIDSEPQGVRCILRGRTGDPVAVTTPRLVFLPPFGEAIEIECLADGYFRVRKTVLRSTAATLTQRLLGGESVGAAFGPVRGREKGPGGEFPEWIRIDLPQVAFVSGQQRDAFYGRQREQAERAWKAHSDALAAECLGGGSARGVLQMSEPCRAALDLLAKRRAAELSEIEVHRRRATVR